MRSSRQARRLTYSPAVFLCALLACAGTALAEANHTGWPHQEHHEGHPNNESGVMRGQEGVHNYLLGGGGNDTIYAGNDGDVIWGDSHPADSPRASATSYTAARVKTGSTRATAKTRSGPAPATTTSRSSTATAPCSATGPGLKTLVMRYLPQNRPWKLVGCDHKVIDPYRA